jgi:hypothetical protein
MPSLLATAPAAAAAVLLLLLFCRVQSNAAKGNVSAGGRPPCMPIMPGAPWYFDTMPAYTQKQQQQHQSRVLKSMQRPTAVGCACRQVART